MIEENKWEFKCPKCGADSRLVQAVVDRDRAEGRIGDKVLDGALHIQEFPIADNMKQPKLGDKVSVLLVFSDICQDCGTIYIHKVIRDIRKVSVDVSKLMRPNIIPPQIQRHPNFPGFGGRGN